jgi:hypothetical protein
MNSALYSRAAAIIALTGATDLSTKRGHTVTFSGETATLSASASVPATGVILEGRPTTDQSTIAILGSGHGSVLLKASGAITKGARIQQHTDGSVVTDAGSGARVVIGVALETAASGDLFEAALITPLTLS